MSSGVIREARQASKKEYVDFECAISVVTGVSALTLLRSCVVPSKGHKCHRGWKSWGMELCPWRAGSRRAEQSRMPAVAAGRAILSRRISPEQVGKRKEGKAQVTGLGETGSVATCGFQRVASPGARHAGAGTGNSGSSVAPTRRDTRQLCSCAWWVPGARQVAALGEPRAGKER